MPIFFLYVSYIRFRRASYIFPISCTPICSRYITTQDKALDYYDKLKPDCVDQGLSYEDRVAMRKEEILTCLNLTVNGYDG